MRRTLIVIALISFFGSLHAQRINAYVTAGVTLSQIEGDELKGFKQGCMNGGVGALAVLDSRNIWYLSVEALFAQRGSFNNTGDPYNTSLRLSYVDIPLLLHYRDPYGGIMAGLGLSYGRLVEQPHSNIAYTPNYFIPDTSDMNFLSNDLSVVADVRFFVWKSLMANLRWQYSLIPIKRDWKFTEYVGNQVKTHTNNCYSHSLTLRLLWLF